MKRTALCACGVLSLLLAGVAILAKPADEGYHVLKTIKVGGEGGWDYLTMDPEAQRLYISRATRVQVVDVEKGEVVGEVKKTEGVHGIALVPKLNRGFTSNGRDGSVTVFDLKTLEEVGRIEKVGTNPDGIIYDPATERVFTFNGRSKNATAIDPQTQKVVGTIDLGGKPESAVSDEKGQIFVNLEDKDQVLALDAKELSVKSRFDLEAKSRPVGLAMDRANRRLFCSCGNQKMAILDADSGKVITTVSIGKGTDYCSFDPETKMAFSSNGDGTLTVVEEQSPDQFRVVQNVATQQGARTMALDPKTHRVYLVTAKFKAREAGAKGRPGIEPDSFVVLVVGK